MTHLQDDKQDRMTTTVSRGMSWKAEKDLFGGQAAETAPKGESEAVNGWDDDVDGSGWNADVTECF